MGIQKAILINGLAIPTAIVVNLSLSPIGYTYPEVQKSDIHMLTCYMEAADGRVLNLSSICGKIPKSILNSIFSAKSDSNPYSTTEPDSTLPPTVAPNYSLPH